MGAAHLPRGFFGNSCMSFSDEYKAGYSGNYGPNIDTLSYSFQMGQNDRDRQIREGTYGNQSGGAFAGLSVGPVLFAVVVLVAIAAFFLAWISYPIAGILTGITFGVAAFFLQEQGMNGTMQIFALAVPCYIVFRFALMLEHKVAKLKLYRIFRQCWRIFAGTSLVHALARRLHVTGNPTMDAYIIDGVLTGLAPFAFYLNSIRLDVKYMHAPIRFKWIDMILVLVKNRFVRPAMKDIRETSALPVRDITSNAVMNAQVTGGRVAMGNVNVPVGNILRCAHGRRQRFGLSVAGLILGFIFIGSIGGGNGAETRGFLSQIVGLAGLAIAALLLVWAFIPNALAGKLGGPFRFLEVFYIGENGADGGKVRMQFNSAEDEHRFVSAIENGLKAMPRSTPNVDIDTHLNAPVPAT